MDLNYISFSADLAGNIYRNGVLLFPADVEGIRTWDEPAIIVPSGGYSDALKVSSGVERLRITCPLIDARHCLEDAIDINNARKIEIEVDELYAAQRYCGTIKGGSDEIEVVVGLQIGHGLETDWDFGNHSDQSSSRTQRTALDVGSTADGAPVKARVLHAWDPVLTGNIRFEMTDIVQGFWGHLYRFLKKWLGKIGIKI